MAKKRPTPERIVTLLREIEVATLQKKSISFACREAGISDQLRDELLNGEIFCSFKETEVLIEPERPNHNTVRRHSSLGCRPPAAQTFVPSSYHLDRMEPMQ